MTSFLKMHGLGNDFAVFDGRVFPVPMTAAIARAIADRKRGIGCDQVIVMEKGQNGTAAFMRIFNADGSEVEHGEGDHAWVPAGARCAPGLHI